MKNRPTHLKCATFADTNSIERLTCLMKCRLSPKSSCAAQTKIEVSAALQEEVAIGNIRSGTLNRIIAPARNVVTNEVSGARPALPSDPAGSSTQTSFLSTQRRVKHRIFPKKTAILRGGRRRKRSNSKVPPSKSSFLCPPTSSRDGELAGC
jgi:hypothetical protein